VEQKRRKLIRRKGNVESKKGNKEGRKVWRKDIKNCETGKKKQSNAVGGIFSCLTYLLTPWSRVLLEKLTVVKKFPVFMELESSSPYPQAPAVFYGCVILPLETLPPHPPEIQMG
jgi:hypothetical protein